MSFLRHSVDHCLTLRCNIMLQWRRPVNTLLSLCMTPSWTLSFSAFSTTDVFAWDIWWHHLHLVRCHNDSESIAFSIPTCQGHENTNRQSETSSFGRLHCTSESSELHLVVGHDIDNTEHVYINVDTHSMSILERYKHELELYNGKTSSWSFLQTVKVELHDYIALLAWLYCTSVPIGSLEFSVFFK